MSYVGVHVHMVRSRVDSWRLRRRSESTRDSQIYPLSPRNLVVVPVFPRTLWKPLTVQKLSNDLTFYWRHAGRWWACWWTWGDGGGVSGYITSMQTAEWGGGTAASEGHVETAIIQLHAARDDDTRVTAESHTSEDAFALSLEVAKRPFWPGAPWGPGGPGGLEVKRVKHFSHLSIWDERFTLTISTVSCFSLRKCSLHFKLKKKKKKKSMRFQQKITDIRLNCETFLCGFLLQLNSSC